MPAGGLRPQLVSPLVVGADDGVAVAALATTAAFGNGAAVCVAGAGSEPPPPQAASRASKLSEESRVAKGLGFLTRTRLELKVECMNKLSAGTDTSDAMGCNQTKARV